MRLTTIGREARCVSDERWTKFGMILDNYTKTQQLLNDINFTTEKWTSMLADSAPAFGNKSRRLSVLDLISAHNVMWPKVETALLAVGALSFAGALDAHMVERCRVERVYRPAVDSMRASLDDVARESRTLLPVTLDYAAITGLRSELRQLLTESRYEVHTFAPVHTLLLSRPSTLAAAARLPGMTPVALDVVMRHARAHTRRDEMIATSV
jgi:tRNA uridine 5-carboxymethylaminomethyl modification enzyme